MIAIVQFSDSDTPGSIPGILKDLSEPFDVVKLYDGRALPAVDELSGVVMLGAPDSVNGSAPWIRRMLRAVDVLLERDIPMIGHCFGAQLLATALGAQVRVCPQPEIGWTRIEPVTTREGVRWPAAFTALSWHTEGFDTPTAATPLWRSADWEHEGFACGPHLALQFHLEATAAELDRWSKSNRMLLASGASGVNDFASLQTKRITRLREQHKVARSVYARWVYGLRNRAPSALDRSTPIVAPALL